MMSPVWLLNRLRAMEPAEVRHRVRSKVDVLFQRAGFGRAMPRTPEGATGKPWAEAGFDVDATPYVAAADRILEGRFDVFAMRDALLGFPPDWGTCPKTGIQAPTSFGRTLNYRDESLVGDIKYLWEPSRHLQLVTLAQAWHLTRDARYGEACRTLLDSWFEQCPYAMGPHWTSSLEHAVRLVNWAVAWQLLGGDAAPVFQGDDGKAFRERWLRSIYQHCHFIAGHFSRHSSANNHLLGELMGLFIASVTWPMWPESNDWQDDARRELEVEALRQNAPDGVNREQGFWYHHEVADMLLLCLLFGRANGVEFSADYIARLRAMLDFIAAVMDVGGNVPAVGDADDAVMVRFSSEARFDVYRSLLATGAVLFGDSRMARKAGCLDHKTVWLLGNGACERLFALQEESAHSRSVSRAFPDGGYWVLGADLDSRSEVHILADAGPLGYLSIAAHGHADALSLCMSAAGEQILVDPGTFAYHTQKAWRDYFRGTSAHNTLRVDGVDQSRITGNFMWGQRASARCTRFETDGDSDVWIADHDGYARLADPVLHERRVHLDKHDSRIEVVDAIRAKSNHAVELFWHFHPDCQVEMEGRQLVVRRLRSITRISMPDVDWAPRLMRGSEHPIAGWYSPRFDEKQPTTTAVFAGNVTASAALRTVMTIEFRN